MLDSQARIWSLIKTRNSCSREEGLALKLGWKRSPNTKDTCLNKFGTSGFVSGDITGGTTCWRTIGVADKHAASSRGGAAKWSKALLV